MSKRPLLHLSSLNRRFPDSGQAVGPPADVGQCLVIAAEVGLLLSSSEWVEAREAACHPTTHRTVPTTENEPLQMSGPGLSRPACNQQPQWQ